MIKYQFLTRKICRSCFCKTLIYWKVKYCKRLNIIGHTWKLKSAKQNNLLWISFLIKNILLISRRVKYSLNDLIKYIANNCVFSMFLGAIADSVKKPYRYPSCQVDVSKCTVCTDGESKRSSSRRVISHRFLWDLSATLSSVPC